MNSYCNFVIVGAGNLGTRISIALKDTGHTALQIINPNKEKARILSEKVGGSYGVDIEINNKADIVFIATNDDSIPDVVKKYKNKDLLFVHLSGSTSMSVFNPDMENYGVFYPLQSFTADVDLDFKNIPILLEASSAANYKILESIACSISEKVFKMDSDKRLKCHLGAIIAANFSNHFIALGEKYLKENELPVEILHPLLDEMISKIKKHGAEKAMTGPARRNDLISIQKHIEILKDKPDLQKIYTFVSDNIINFYRKSNS